MNHLSCKHSGTCYSIKVCQYSQSKKDNFTPVFFSESELGNTMGYLSSAAFLPTHAMRKGGGLRMGYPKSMMANILSHPMGNAQEDSIFLNVYPFHKALWYCNYKSKCLDM